MTASGKPARRKPSLRRPCRPRFSSAPQEFTFSKVDGNNTRFIVRASNATEFKEGGRTLLEDVWITTFGGSGERVRPVAHERLRIFRRVRHRDLSG